MEFDEMDLAGMSALEVMAARQDATERALMELARAVKAMEAQLAKLAGASRAEKREIEIGSITGAADEGPVEPEMAAVIAAAATTFVDINAKPGSAKAAQGGLDKANAWSQQGRVVVQTSHNFRSR